MRPEIVAKYKSVINVWNDVEKHIVDVRAECYVIEILAVKSINISESHVVVKIYTVEIWTLYLIQS